MNPARSVLCLLISSGAQVLGATHYVDLNSPSPSSPYTSWPTAATTIQDAVDAASAGDEIVVTNGLYTTGGKAVGDVTNRAAIDKAVTVRSVHGPGFTVISGSGVPGSVRCVYLANGARLSGFTLTNGLASAGIAPRGGGLWCETTNAIASNCVIVGNEADYAGGGVSGGTLFNSIINSNFTPVLGRGLTGLGGGAYNSVLNNCLVMGNRSGTNGGGVFGGALNHCTVTGNTAPEGNFGGGLSDAVEVRNSIIYFNTPDNGWGYNHAYCCTVPDPGGPGNITAAPLFLDLPGGNLRLQSNSPCINAGNNAYVICATDLDGNPRIIGGTVDMGAYEFQGPTGLTGFHAWLAQYGLPTDGSADYTDTDADGMNNWQEWRAATNPTNAASVLRIVSVSPAGTNVMLDWQSVLGAGYSLQRSTSLAPATSFSTIETNIAGQPTITTFVDTNAAVNSRLFYRVRVQ